eukprot:CFRG2422T1
MTTARGGITEYSVGRPFAEGKGIASSPTENCRQFHDASTKVRNGQTSSYTDNYTQNSVSGRGSGSGSGSGSGNGSGSGSGNGSGSSSKYQGNGENNNYALEIRKKSGGSQESYLSGIVEYFTVRNDGKASTGRVRRKSDPGSMPSVKQSGRLFENANTRSGMKESSVYTVDIFGYPMRRKSGLSALVVLNRELQIMVELCKRLGTRPAKVNINKAEDICRLGGEIMDDSFAKAQRRAYRYHSHLARFSPSNQSGKYQKLLKLYIQWWRSAYNTSNIDVVDTVIRDIKSTVTPFHSSAPVTCSPPLLPLQRRNTVSAYIPPSTRRMKSLPLSTPSQGLSRLFRSITRSCSLGTGDVVDIRSNRTLSVNEYSCSSGPSSGFVTVGTNVTPTKPSKPVKGIKLSKPVALRSKSVNIPERKCSSMAPNTISSISSPNRNNICGGTDGAHLSRDSGSMLALEEDKFHEDELHVFPMSMTNTDEEDDNNTMESWDAMTEISVSNVTISGTVSRENSRTHSRRFNEHSQKFKKWAPSFRKRAAKGFSDMSSLSVDLMRLRGTRKYDAYSPNVAKNMLGSQ